MTRLKNYYNQNKFNVWWLLLLISLYAIGVASVHGWLKNPLEVFYSEATANLVKCADLARTDEQRWRCYLYDETLARGLNWHEFDRLRSIAGAESSWRQYEKDGKTVLRGWAHRCDVGLFQINECVHEAKAKELGMDIYTPEGNIDFALVLYEKEGTRPWVASKHNW